MKILITGAGGFIGSACRRDIEQRGWEWVSYDHVDGFDVCDRGQFRVAVFDHRPDAVVNLAGRLGTSETFGSEYVTAEANILGAINVADVCAELQIPLVQIGTGHKGQPNPYAITKACAEDLLIARARTTGQPISVVRAYHAYGPGQKPFPPHGTSGVRKIIPSFVCRALTGMPIEINGSGEQVIDLVHVDDVARLLVDTAWALTDGHGIGDTYEAGTGCGTTVNEAALDVIAAVGSDVELIHVPMRDGEPEETIVVAEMPECQHLWPYGLDETIDYYRGVIARLAHQEAAG